MPRAEFVPKSKRGFPYIPALVFAGITILGVLGTWYVYVQVDGFLRQRIVERAATVAAAIDPALLGTLTGSAQDLETPAYRLLKERMQAIRAANHDARFVYLMGERDGEVFFFVDSEDPLSEDYSPPGQIFDEATQILIGVFGTGVPAVEVATDRWGNWVSGLAPITSAGTVLAIAGMDIDARSYLVTLLAYSSIPLFATLILLLVLLLLYRARREEERRIDARAELLAIASHEIRSPLTGIRWAAEAMLSGKPSISEEVRRPLTRIYESSLLIIDRINNLLAINALENRNTKVRVTDFALLPEVKRAADIIGLVAEHKGLTISISPSLTDVVMMHADLEKIQTLFANLLSNAVKYATEHSTITVRYSEENAMQKIEIGNQGKGIPSHDLPHIFSGYYRAQNVAGTSDGTGMGLFLTKKIVEMHGGAISASSVEGGETIFTILLPKGEK